MLQPHMPCMQLHLIKLSVGPKSLNDLAEWQAQRLRERGKRQPQELMHITRQMPKRAAELLPGGSIYWVINGVVCARQQLLALRPVSREGVAHCGIVYKPHLIRVQPRARRPFQGWRYLEAKDAPRDLDPSAMTGDDALMRELAALGLL